MSGPTTLGGWPDGSAMTLMSSKTGEVLATEGDAHVSRPWASVTKLVVALAVAREFQLAEVDLAAPARRANREIYAAKPAAEVVPDDPELQRRSHGKIRAGRLDKIPQSCGNPTWQTALRWLEQTRGAMSPNFHAPGLLAPAPERCRELLELQGNWSLPR